MAETSQGKAIQIMPVTRDKRGKEENSEVWVKIELFAPDEMIDALTDFLTEHGAQGAFQEFPEPVSLLRAPLAPIRVPLKTHLAFNDRVEERLAALQRYIESLAELFPELEKPTFRTEVIRDPGWGEAWKKYFKPFRVGRNFIIKPTWEPFTPEGRDIVIEIDPGMAFGTGQHASTRMCLLGIEELLLTEGTFAKWNVLDVGTGTGILGIACAKLGAEQVLCVDIDPAATTIARENVLVNRVERSVGISERDVAALSGPFSLIAANLTATVLINLHDRLVSLTAPGGYLVISGIMEQDRPAIEARFLDDDLSLYRLLTEKEWAAYVLKKEVDRP